MGVTCSLAGIVTLEVFGVVPVSSLQKIDRMLDDGNLTNGYVFVEGPVDNPYFLQFVVTCH